MLEAFFNKVAGLKACNFIKRRLQHRCFPEKFANFLRTPFFTEHLQCLLLLKKVILIFQMHVWTLIIFVLTRITTTDADVQIE